ncbi:N-acetyltransferase family protein [Streptococcus sp. zg-JUN1979]|uniref:GNAT family N-acetyltransferase n=1 Tax=Streptococcus sp. zg-JUN1979 TaxID=3391450 RepID=UPI0039A66314
MPIRRAKKEDIEAIQVLLGQILEHHHQLRPDLFEKMGSKFTSEELLDLLEDETKPVFVYEDDKGAILGHLFTAIYEAKMPKVSHKTLFIDDLCVDQTARGQKIGEQLYQFALDLAKQENCYNITLDVWEGNDGARRFYERLGLRPQMTVLEQIL